MTRKRTGLALATALVLSLVGCGNEPVDTTTNSLILDAGGALFSILKRTPEQNFSLTRAQLAGINTPLLWIEVPATESSGSALAVAQNQDAVTWVTANAATLITKNDVIFGTRGLGPDLLTAETEQSTAAIQRRTASRYPKTYRFLDGDETIRKERYFCEMEIDGAETRTILEIRHNTTRFRESCYALKGVREFRNQYWVGADGTIWESSQWISPQAGYLRFQRLIR